LSRAAAHRVSLRNISPTLWTPYLPVPVRFAVCGELTALSAMLKVPVLVPVWVGVNTTLMVQFPRAATLVPQVVAETLKSPAVEGTTPVSATLWWLVRVNTFAGLVVPTVRTA